MTSLLIELDALVAARLSARDEAPAAVDTKALLEIALANEISASELAAAWMPTTAEVDVKIAFARQAGDEAGHFQLVASRMAALGFDVAAYVQPPASPLFELLRGLTSTVERIAAGLYTLESIAYRVNEGFVAYCAARGDADTVAIYRDYIQPDERAHRDLGRQLLAKHATTPALHDVARLTVARVLDAADAARSRTAQRIGTACFPGC